MAVLENHPQAIANGLENCAMSCKYATYATYYSREEAEDLQEFFLRRNLVCVLDFFGVFFELSHSPLLDKNKVKKTYRVMMEPHLFPHAEELQLENLENNIDALPENYPLYSFTDLELFDVLEKFDTWSKLDIILARKILEERGLPVDLETIDSIKKKRMEVLQKPMRISLKELIIGYASCLIFGLMGVVYISDFIKYKELPNGDLMKNYDDYTHKHYRAMLILGVLSSVFWICFLFTQT